MNSVDALDLGNLMRFSNHADSKQMSNSKSVIVFNNTDSTIYLQATRNIKEGEEILFDYHQGAEFDWVKEYNSKFMINSNE